MEEEGGGAVVVKVEDDDGERGGSGGRECPGQVGLVSLKSILAPLAATDSHVAQFCRRVRPLLERQGIRTFKRKKAVHVLQSDVDKVVRVGKGSDVQ